ncbi:MAG: hypothetical protein ACOYNN_15460, partial [Terrimicrobiaceae bacterium]
IEVSSTPSSAPIAAPIAAAPPMTATPPPIYTAPTSSAGGGGDSFTDILKGLNWVEIGISLLGVTALVYTISYFRYNFKVVKPEIANMQNQIDDLTIKLSEFTSKQESQQQVSANGVNTQGFYI